MYQNCSISKEGKLNQPVKIIRYTLLILITLTTQLAGKKSKNKVKNNNREIFKLKQNIRKLSQDYSTMIYDENIIQIKAMLKDLNAESKKLIHAITPKKTIPRKQTKPILAYIKETNNLLKEQGAWIKETFFPPKPTPFRSRTKLYLKSQQQLNQAANKKSYAKMSLEQLKEFNGKLLSFLQALFRRKKILSRISIDHRRHIFIMKPKLYNKVAKTEEKTKNMISKIYNLMYSENRFKHRNTDFKSIITNCNDEEIEQNRTNYDSITYEITFKEKTINDLAQQLNLIKESLNKLKQNFEVTQALRKLKTIIEMYGEGKQFYEYLSKKEMRCREIKAYVNTNFFLGLKKFVLFAKQPY